SARRRDAAPGDDLVPDEGPPCAGPNAHRARGAGRGRDRLQPGHVTHAEPAACDDRRLSQPADDARRGPRRRYDQRGPGAGPGRGDRLARGGQAGRPGGLERADVPPDPVLARGATRSDGRQARPGRAGPRVAPRPPPVAGPCHGRRDKERRKGRPDGSRRASAARCHAGGDKERRKGQRTDRDGLLPPVVTPAETGSDRQTLPRLSRRTVVVSAGRPEVVTESFGWTAGSPPISWKNLASASRTSTDSSSSGIATTILGSSWAINSAVFCGLRVPPIGTHAMSTGPMSASSSSFRRWPISPRWIVWIPSSSIEKATWFRRLPSLPSSRYVRTPVRRTSRTSYSPGPSRTNA